MRGCGRARANREKLSMVTRFRHMNQMKHMNVALPAFNTITDRPGHVVWKQVLITPFSHIMNSVTTKSVPQT